MSEEIKNAVLDFIGKVNVKKELKLSTETQKKLSEALINMAKKEQKGGGFYIADSEMEDLIVDYQTTIKKYGVETKAKEDSVEKSVAKAKTMYAKANAKKETRKEEPKQAPTTQKYESVGLF